MKATSPHEDNLRAQGIEHSGTNSFCILCEDLVHASTIARKRTHLHTFFTSGTKSCCQNEP